MKIFGRIYYLILQTVGLISVLGLVAFAVSQGIEVNIVILVMLSLIGAWLRFDLRPTGYLTLAPLISFVSLLLYPPYDSVLIASLSAAIGSRFFGRNEWRVAAEETGEESASMALSALTFLQMVRSQPNGTAFFVAVLVYVLCRLVFTTLTGRLRKGIAALSVASVVGRYLFANILVLATLAFGITRATGIYSSGFLGFALMTIALAEFYRPWKLLSQQAQDLYLSLAIIAEAIDIKDPYTGRHSRRVAEMATQLARRLNLSEHEVNTVRIGALLHDIGKIGVSGSIIRKPASLESTEVKAMQRHPVISADIMAPVEYFREAARHVRHHHEHYDGTGYPDGLKAEEIPIGSRIILVADAFDAMTTDRPYRKGRTGQEALWTLRERAGKQFDARVVQALEEIMGEFIGL